jgi:1,4-alpha-glucan branching enzyme
MNRFSKLFAILLSIIGIGQAYAQVVTYTPNYVTVNDSITIIFNSSQGNGALAGADSVWIHTGIITDRSASSGDWHYKKRAYAFPDSSVLMTKIATNVFRIKFKVNSWYGFNTQEKVRALAMVFRNRPGTQVGKNADGSDIFIPIFNSGFSAKITSPVTSYIISGQNQTIPISISANQSAFINVFTDGVLTGQTSAASTFNINVSSGSYGVHWIKLSAESGVNTVLDSIKIVTQAPQVVQDPPSGTGNGINIINDSTVVLCLLAPYKNDVYVLGDFNDWQVTPEYYMNKSLNGERYWLQINGLTPNEEVRFQYLVDNKIRIADPHCEKILDPYLDVAINPVLYPNLIPYPAGKTYEIVSVMQPGQAEYNWQITNFQKPDNRDLNIYELLVRDFVTRHTFKTVRDSIHYLKKLGVTAVQFMPLTEFDGNESWGYGPNFFFAVDKTYGPKKDLKELIDSLHANGIAVILDIVLNHAYGLSPHARLWWDEFDNKPSNQNPYLNKDATHAFSVGYDFNHDSQYTRQFVDTVLAHWVKEYKIDGFRFDLSKGFTQTSTVNSPNPVGDWSAYDASRIYNIKRLSTQLWQNYPGTYVILEHFADKSEEQELAGHGCMLWGKAHAEYGQAAMAWSTGWDFSNAIDYRSSQHGFPFHNLVGFMESHDEERLMYNNKTYGNGTTGYSTKAYTTRLERFAQAAAFFFPVPGPKMTWMFGELGYDYSINYPTNTADSRTSPKPVKWDYMNSPARMKLYKTYAALGKLRTINNSFKTSNFSISAFGTQKQLYVNDPIMNTIVFGNFDVIAQDVFSGFQHTGIWYEYFTGIPLNVTDVNMTLNLGPGKFKLYTDVQLPLPDMSATDSLLAVREIELNSMNVMVSPNPFNAEVQMRYFVEENSHVTIAIYDMLGREIKGLVDEQQSKGIQQITWDGKNMQGNFVPAGNYFYRITAGTYTQSGKLMKFE